MREYSAPPNALDHPCRIQREASVVWTLEKKTEREKEEGERERERNQRDLLLDWTFVFSHSLFSPSLGRWVSSLGATTALPLRRPTPKSPKEERENMEVGPGFFLHAPKEAKHVYGFRWGFHFHVYTALFRILKEN